MRQRTSRPCSLSQPVSYSEGKKTLGKLVLSALQNPTLVAFEAPEIIGSQFLRDKLAALLLAVEGVAGDHTAFQGPLGQLAEQGLESGNFITLFFDGFLRD